MNILEAINTRRSVRNFTPRKVEEGIIERILLAATNDSPDTPPWAFAVIQNVPLLKSLSDEAKSFLLEQYSDPNSALSRYKKLMDNPEFNMFYNTNTLVVIYAKPDSVQPEEDCSQAAQSIMMASFALGLGSCQIAFATDYLNLPQAKTKLGVPADYTAVAPIILGYTKDTTSTPEIICWRK